MHRPCKLHTVHMHTPTSKVKQKKQYWIRQVFVYCFLNAFGVMQLMCAICMLSGTTIVHCTALNCTCPCMCVCVRAYVCWSVLDRMFSETWGQMCICIVYWIFFNSKFAIWYVATGLRSFDFKYLFAYVWIENLNSNGFSE